MGYQDIGPQTNITNPTGTLPIANGGTGQVTANAALNALLPTQTANSGNFLTTNGTNTSWSAVAPTSAYNVTQSEVILYGSSAYANPATKIPKFITIVKNTGADITLIQSASSGTVFQINTTGRYAFSVGMESPTNASQAMGISVNAVAGDLTTNIYDVASANRMAYGAVGSITAQTQTANACWQGNLNAGDLVRPHGIGAQNNGVNYAYCMAVRIG